MKSYRFNRATGELNEIENDTTLPIYNSIDDAEMDLDNLEVGQIVGTKDEVTLIDQFKQELDEAITEALTGLGSVPAGTIIELPKEASNPAGYLKTDGSTFDESKYPFLYANLGNTNVLPLELVRRDPVLNQEVMTGEVYDGKPVYAYRFADAATRSGTTWYTLSVNGDNYFPATMRMERVIRMENQSSHDSDDFNGVVDSCIFQIRNQGTATAQISFYCSWQSYYTADRPRYITMYYTKTDEGFPTDTHYKYIRAISGNDTTDEADEVVNAITELKDKIAYQSLPVGHIISVLNDDNVPYGYLKLDGSEYDINEYPVLYSYLGTNQLPDVRDDDETVLWEGTTGAYNTNIPFSESLLNFDKVLIYTGRLPSTKRENWGCQVFDRETIARMASFGTSGDGAYWGGPNYASQYTRYYLTSDGMTFRYLNGGSAESSIYKVVGVGKRHKFIKAVSGIDESSSEAQNIVDHMQDLTDKVSYSGLPLGTIISRPKTDVLAGYLKCDGSEFDQEQYPGLYSILNDNHTPVVPDTDIISAEPDWYKVLNWGDNRYWGTAEVTQYSKGCFPDEAEYDGTMMFQVDDWCILHILHTDGTSWATCVGWRSDSDKMTTIPIKKGDKFYINRVTGQNAWTSETDAYDGTMVAIWYYKEYKWIKCVDGVQDTEDTAVVQAVNDAKQAAIDAMTSATADLMNIPVGTITKFAGTDLPDGYLWCDGEQFDRNDYPALYARLNDDHTPTIFDKEDVLYENASPLLGANAVNIPLDYCIWDYEWIRLDVFTNDSCARGEKMYKVSDLKAFMEDTSPNYDLLISQYGTDYQEFGIAEDGLSLIYRAGNSTAGAAIHKIVGFKTTTSIIKASSGLVDGQPEAQTIVTEVTNLADKVAYNGLPVGSVIELHSNDFTPAGYIKCDGSEFDTDKYPVLASLLNSNKVPEIYSDEQTVLTDLTVAKGNETITCSESMFNFARIRIEGGCINENYKLHSYEFERDYMIDAVRGGSHRIFIFGYYNNYTYYKVSADGTQLVGDETGGGGNWRGVLRIVGIGRFNKYIKAVTGIDDNTDEAVEVKDAINAAEAGMKQTLEDCKTELVNAYGQSYSTTEQWTGGYWIDGKKIYRRAGHLDSISTATVVWAGARDEIDRLLDVRCIGRDGSTSGNYLVGGYYPGTPSNRIILWLQSAAGGNLIYADGNAVTLYDVDWWVEYTRSDE